MGDCLKYQDHPAWVRFPSAPSKTLLRGGSRQNSEIQFQLRHLSKNPRTSFPIKSSLCILSISSSTILSIYKSVFDGTDSPSMIELCELLSESPNVRQQFLSHDTHSRSWSVLKSHWYPWQPFDWCQDLYPQPFSCSTLLNLLLISMTYWDHDMLTH